MLAVLEGRSSRLANPAVPAARPPNEGEIPQNLAADRAPSGLGAIRILRQNRNRNSEASAKRTSRRGDQDDDGRFQRTGLSHGGSFPGTIRKPGRFCTDMPTKRWIRPSIHSSEQADRQRIPFRRNRREERSPTPGSGRNR